MLTMSSWVWADVPASVSRGRSGAIEDGASGGARRESVRAAGELWEQLRLAQEAARRMESELSLVRARLARTEEVSVSTEQQAFLRVSHTRVKPEHSAWRGRQSRQRVLQRADASRADTW